MIAKTIVLTAFALLPGLLFSANTYVQHNLVSDLPGIADHQDASLINPWGIATSATSPFWPADNGSGLSTIYNSAGVPNALKVVVPSATGGQGKPTGIVNNPTTVFVVGNGAKANFIFATEDGTISGWASAVDATHAIIKVDKSASGAVYKGLALATATAGPQLYAANFNAGTIDVFDANFAPVSIPGGFTDATIPAGFAPFNIQNLGGKLYVTYAKQDAAKKNDVAGPGNGYVDVFDLNGVKLQSLIAAGPLNSPWGVAIAPASFGDFSNALLVGNFGNGKINAFNATTGALLGTLQDAQSNQISIPGLWALQVGNGGNGGDANAVYFAAGIGGGPNNDPIQSHGLLGSIQAPPAIDANAVINGASLLPGTAQNTWIAIKGANMAATMRTWVASDFVNGKLPTTMDGVTVTVNGKPAYIYYVSPKQINVLTPVDNTVGTVTVQTVNNLVNSASTTVQMQALMPAFFLINSDKYVVALHSDAKSLIGPTTLFPGQTTPAKPGEVIVLWGTGFGPTDIPIPDGQIVTAPFGNLVPKPTIRFGGVASPDVQFAGLTVAGVYQINVVIPPGTPDGDIAVVAQVGSTQSPDNKAFITVQH